MRVSLILMCSEISKEASCETSDFVEEKCDWGSRLRLRIDGNLVGLRRPRREDFPGRRDITFINNFISNFLVS